ncbi:hypothetical protein [Alkalihalobacillus trypoxylicola]|uniref:Uncharacterized protein n=1 Tax=Alkalihalobacillus trypoxylicola TaxID=519424 RepID=A0A162EZF9_9BACI|nr:hypothetical protein [Alkalihalobacillus trypoxylicola]KYG34106.1 hypothetical protein AZF04_14850 [Alkalihalobacillus trypoxylicola]
MKKTMAATLLSIGMFLGACNSEQASNQSNNNETDIQTEDVGAREEDTNEEENPSEGSLTAEEILEEAIALYNDLDGLYVVRGGSGDINLDPPESDEAGNLDLNLEMNTYEWIYMIDGDYYNRTELVSEVYGEEGENGDMEERTSYSFTELDNPTYLISYEEGDGVGIRFESPIEEFSFSMLGERYQSLLNNAELTFIGEEEVNGFHTYHIKSEQNGHVEEYWFDSETFFEVKVTSTFGSSTGVDSVDSLATAEDQVMEYELNPDFDETLFQVPNDLEISDGQLEDTLEE